MSVSSAPDSPESIDSGSSSRRRVGCSSSGGPLGTLSSFLNGGGSLADPIGEGRLERRELGRHLLVVALRQLRRQLRRVAGGSDWRGRLERRKLGGTVFTVVALETSSAEALKAASAGRVVFEGDLARVTSACSSKGCIRPATLPSTTAMLPLHVQRLSSKPLGGRFVEHPDYFIGDRL